MINMSVAEMSIRRGRAAGIMMALGAATVEFFQIFIAIKFGFYLRLGFAEDKARSFNMGYTLNFNFGQMAKMFGRVSEDGGREISL